MTEEHSPALVRLSARERRRRLIGFVSRKVDWLWSLPQSDRRAALANLRRALSQPPGDSPATWEVEFGGMPPGLAGWGDSPSQAEAAVHGALTLYATHQQSHNDVSVHQPKVSLGAAVARLAARDRAVDSPADRPPDRFAALVTADTLSEQLHHARGLIQQLRSSEPLIRLDYGLLAADLDALQRPSTAHGVRVRWARDFAHDSWASKADDKQSTNQTTDGGQTDV
ncbi:MAG: type I-E CRISPR-associated protein Cse2/CasB [Bifidobacteriaceae bacterium]|jgi:CRISPR system Cascade subunit CasB|nr:type I-E CRISPR-associated protein Cse2/CasB [Bifidobacteriaceae bacterium]